MPQADNFLHKRKHNQPKADSCNSATHSTMAANNHFASPAKCLSLPRNISTDLKPHYERT